jgi:hypothetical protein
VLIALRTLAATRTAMLGMLEPVVTVGLSVALLADAMTWPRLAGIVTVLTGIAMFYLRLRQGPGGAAFRPAGPRPEATSAAIPAPSHRVPEPPAGAAGSRASSSGA